MKRIGYSTSKYENEISLGEGNCLEKLRSTLWLCDFAGVCSAVESAQEALERVTC